MQANRGLYLRVWRAEQFELDLCRDCNRPLTPGYRTCETHRECMRVYMQERRRGGIKP